MKNTKSQHVYYDSDNEAIIYAAQELSGYLAKMSGCSCEPIKSCGTAGLKTRMV